MIRLTLVERSQESAPFEIETDTVGMSVTVDTHDPLG
jgi:hypothetical protein